MSRTLLYTATGTDAGKRLDVVCADNGLYPSRSAAANAISDEQVLVNGNLVSKKHLVKEFDAIVYTVEEVEAFSMCGTPIPLDIRYEDDDVIVLSKQVGLVCHPSIDHLDDTLVNALIYHCGIDNLCNVQGEEDRPGIVHRLDRDTSGLMLAAKTDDCGYDLMEGIRTRSVDRHYLALVHGVIAPDSGMIDAPIARHATDRMKMAIRDVPSARDAVTTFKVLERFEPSSHDDGYTLIMCKLFTGRTHQIRVHLEYTRHPLVGDPVYSTFAPKHTEADLGLERQFLHSFQLRFTHPVTEEDLYFVDNPPADLRNALDFLAPRSLGRTEAGEEIFAQLAAAPNPSIEGTVPKTV